MHFIICPLQRVRKLVNAFFFLPMSLVLYACLPLPGQGLIIFINFFGYEETKEAFQIPHDLKILQEVFKFPDGN